MTWVDGAISTLPAGVDSTKKTGLAVVCDVCNLGTEFFSRAVVDRSGPEGIHRLLAARGWTFDLSTGEDACSACTLAVSA